MSSQEQKAILLVEDDPIMAMSASVKLENYGYKVIHVQNGHQAIEAVSDNKTVFDLILMDINLGTNLDSTEIAKLILKEQDIPILFL